MPTTTMPATTMPALALRDALDQVLPAAGSDPHIPHLMGVLLEGKEGSVRLVATDSHRLAIRDLVPSALHRDFSAVVPAATLKEWRSALGAEIDVALDLDGRTVTVSGGDIDLSGLIVPTAFPAYEQLLVPSDGFSKIQIGRERLLTAFESFNVDGAVLLSTSPGGLRIVRREANIIIEAVCTGAESHVAINPAYGADAVRHAVGAEVIVEIGEPLERSSSGRRTTARTRRC